MHKTVYIDVDEEIMGIINKIRKTEATEVFLVVPKNSLLTQGIVNLKLLKKEVLNMNKKIILVTADQHSKRIIKRVGLETKTKSVQDFIAKEEISSINETERLSSKDRELEPELENIEKPKKREIGSRSFYKKTPVIEDSESSVNPTKKEINVLKIENKKLKVTTPNTFGNEFIKNHETKKKFNQETQTEYSTKSLGQKSQSQKNSIDDFYKKPLKEESFTDDLLQTHSPREKKSRFTVSNKKRFLALLSFLTLLVLFPLVFWIFSSWPKMSVELFPQEKIAETNLDLVVCDNKTINDDCLKGDYQELTIEVTQAYQSSGEIFSNDKGRARGLVKIYNNYSSQQQPLVKETRVLSSEGKLFRLIKSIVVPGMKDNEPGFVEALVIADEIGQSYNIGPDEFTIEGFKGNEKYEKFKVISEENMTGGANDIENKKVKVVTETDINSAREQTIDYLNEKIEEKINQQLNEKESFVATSIDKEIISSDSSYAPGDIIDQFNYTIKEKIKVITFNQEDFENLIIQKFEKEISDEYEFDKISTINFQKEIADYQNKVLDLSISAKAIYWPILDKNEIKSNLSDKNNSEIKKYLEDLDKIKKALITYKPAWLSTLPIKNKNISILETK